MQKFYSLILLFIILLSSVDALTTTDGKFDYTINSDGETVTLTGGRSRDLPASIEGMPVTIIGSYAFRDSNLWNGGHELTIPSSVTTIRDWAFYEISITNLYIPNNVTTIYSRAFGDISSLQTVTGGYNVEYYGSQTYFKCMRLKSLYIGRYCTRIGSQLIAGCHSLETLTVSSSNPNYVAIGTVLFNKDCCPTATLLLAVVFAAKADLPKAVLAIPVVFAFNVSCPTATFC